MESAAAACVCSVLFLHLPLISGSSIHIGIGSNYSSLYEQSILPCKKEQLQCGNGLCLLNRLRCHYKKDCSRDYMSIKLTCSNVHSNQSSLIREFPCYSENSNDTSLLVSPLLVAGVVIGLVLFLSCVTIIVGSLRKDGRLRHPYLRRDASYGEIVSASPSWCTAPMDMHCYADTAKQMIKKTKGGYSWLFCLVAISVLALKSSNESYILSGQNEYVKANCIAPVCLVFFGIVHIFVSPSIAS